MSTRDYPTLYLDII